jgi:hypothetical protein
MRVTNVATEHVQQVWPLVEPFIQEAIDKGMGAADYNIHHVQAFLTAGQWLLIVAVDEESRIHGAMTVSFINYPLHRVAFITTTGGKEIVKPETFEQLKAVLKPYGATKIQAMGRESMVRLLAKTGFEPRTTLVEVAL